MSPEIESWIYAESLHRAEIVDGYVNMHIKAKPWYIPNFVYQWLLKKLLVLNFFKK